MRQLLYATTVLLGLSAVPARAEIIDPLHFTCDTCTHVTIGNNDVTLIGAGGLNGLQVTSSPANSGDLTIKLLIPNTFTLTQINNFISAPVQVSNGGSFFPLTLYSTTAWTSGFLETDYLTGVTLGNGAPKNPLDAWLGATKTVQANATGYYLLTADIGQHALDVPGTDPIDPNNVFSLVPNFFAQGGLILGNLLLANGETISTAQSSALFFNGPSSGPFCATPPCDNPPPPPPVPGPIAGAGIPGIIAGAVMLLGLARRRLFSLAA